jgi:hypothetical protein
MSPTPNPSTHCLGVLALEVAAEQSGGALCLPRTEAEALAADLAFDLQRLLPGVAALDGVFAGAHYDPAELLRPGWPVHAMLAELATRVPGDPGGRVIAFGALGQQMPTPLLQPDPALAGGLLRLLPFALVGAAEQVATIGAEMEQRLLDTGMAAAGTALAAQSRFGLLLEHARFMSLHDLCALTAMQYQHAGLEGVWGLLEAALLAPDSEEWLRAPEEPLARFHDGLVRIADPDFAAWQASGGPAGDEAGYQAARRRVRQLAAILGAHGIAVERVPLGAGEDTEALLRPDGGQPPQAPMST